MMIAPTTDTGDTIGPALHEAVSEAIELLTLRPRPLRYTSGRSRRSTRPTEINDEHGVDMSGSAAAR
jgi:hypothetical protein